MLNLNAEPQVTNESTSVEGLVTWTLVQNKRRRLRKMQGSRKHWWLHALQPKSKDGLRHACAIFPHRDPTTATELCNPWLRRTRSQMMMKSPTAGMGDDEKQLMINSHGDICKCPVKLLELGKVEVMTDLLKVFAEAFRTPEPPADDSDDPMSETQSQRSTSIQKQWTMWSIRPGWLGQHSLRPRTWRIDQKMTEICKSFRRKLKIHKAPKERRSIGWDTNLLTTGFSAAGFSKKSQ